MPNKQEKISDKITLVIHSTDNSFGFAYRKNNNHETDNLFVRKFDNDLCNNLIVDFDNFISKENLQKVYKISVTTGPANFNASRLIVVLARTISQQLNCHLDSFSSFELISKRIALKNKICKRNQSFWIYKKLKRKGFIAGQYEVYISEKKDQTLSIKEKIIPKVFQTLENEKPKVPANFNDKEDLKELLNISNKNLNISNCHPWQDVLPLYPLSPIN